MCAATNCRADNFIAFTWVGHVTSIDGTAQPSSQVQIGNFAYLTYTFDTRIADSNPDPSIGSYAGGVRQGALSLVGLIGGNFSATSPISVVNNGVNGDEYRGTFQDSRSGVSIGLNLTDAEGTAFSSDVQPTNVDLPAFQDPSDTATITVEAGPPEAHWRAVVTIERSEVRTYYCLCDFNHDEVVNSQDFFDYLEAFFNGDPRADLNGDLLNTQDLYDFLTCFFSNDSCLR